MKRGDFYRVSKPGGGDPRRHRVFLVVSRQALIDSKFSTVMCAPVYSARYASPLKYRSARRRGCLATAACTATHLVSLSKRALSRFVGTLAAARQPELDRALRTALGLPELVSR